MVCLFDLVGYSLSSVYSDDQQKHKYYSPFASKIIDHSPKLAYLPTLTGHAINFLKLQNYR